MLSIYEPDPWLGNGLAVVLELPRCCEPGETERLVNRLNGWEWCGLECPDEAWHPQHVGCLVACALRQAQNV